MTVKDLRVLLEQYPEAMPVAYIQMSEFQEMQPTDIAPMELFNNGGYLSRSYRRKDNDLVRMWLCFPGH